jgi:hypothetical protein
MTILIYYNFHVIVHLFQSIIFNLRILIFNVFSILCGEEAINVFENIKIYFWCRQIKRIEIILNFCKFRKLRYLTLFLPLFLLYERILIILCFLQGGDA